MQTVGTGTRQVRDGNHRCTHAGGGRSHPAPEKFAPVVPVRIQCRWRTGGFSVGGRCSHRACKLRWWTGGVGGSVGGGRADPREERGWKLQAPVEHGGRNLGGGRSVFLERGRGRYLNADLGRRRGGGVAAGGAVADDTGSDREGACDGNLPLCFFRSRRSSWWNIFANNLFHPSPSPPSLLYNGAFRP